MAKIGHDITSEELDEIMREHDLENNGVISYLEFKAIFLDVDDIRDERYQMMKQENPTGMPTKEQDGCSDAWSQISFLATCEIKIRINPS